MGAVIEKGKEAQNLSEHLVYARTGSDMYARRGGWQYFKSGLKGRKEIYQAGLGSFKDFCEFQCACCRKFDAKYFTR